MCLAFAYIIYEDRRYGLLYDCLYAFNIKNIIVLPYVIFGNDASKIFFLLFLNSRWRIRHVGYSLQEKNPKWFYVHQHLCCKSDLASFIAFYMYKSTSIFSSLFKKKTINIFLLCKNHDLNLYFSRLILASWKLKQRNLTRLHQLNWQRSKSLKER